MTCLYYNYTQYIEYCQEFSYDKIKLVMNYDNLQTFL